MSLKQCLVLCFLNTWSPNVFQNLPKVFILIFNDTDLPAWKSAKLPFTTRMADAVAVFAGEGDVFKVWSTALNCISSAADKVELAEAAAVVCFNCWSSVTTGQ